MPSALGECGDRGHDAPDHQLPATIQPGALTTMTDGSHLVPHAPGLRARLRPILRLVRRSRMALPTIRPFDVATYIETIQKTHSPPGVKQQLAAVRMLFDWLIAGQVVPANPASAVRGPNHVCENGKTPVLDAAAVSYSLRLARIAFFSFKRSALAHGNARLLF